MVHDKDAACPKSAPARETFVYIAAVMARNSVRAVDVPAVRSCIPVRARSNPIDNLESSAANASYPAQGIQRGGPIIEIGMNG